MGWTILALALAYLLGSVPGGLLLGHLAGVNLRAVGSGNAGATNALRAKGPLFGVAVFAFDAGKGIAAVLVLPLLAGEVAWLPVACAGAVIVGHVFPAWFGFRGGKGFATALGTILALAPLGLAPVAGVWVIVLLLAGFVSAATLTAALAWPIFVACMWALDRPALLWFAIALAVFLFFTHRDNLRRLTRNEEHRFQKVWLPGYVRR
ncbi:MAG: glycerol-3-phosphate 1-O-acyltransferase PlsY [Gammaproteobacteria bacterium]|nr:glycerol-3-phosphate 1-O-acyltransferase PlsY [Gammaproteobacteria bacterium]